MAHKCKVHSGAKKRLRRSKSGLLKGAHTRRRKNLIKKTSTLKRKLRGTMYVHPVDAKRILSVLPA